MPKRPFCFSGAPPHMRLSGGYACNGGPSRTILVSNVFSALVLVLLETQCAAVCTDEALLRYADGGYPLKLDTSVYWFGPNDEVERATGGTSKYYDPSKKTVIYFHGWTGHPPGWTVECRRVTSKCDKKLCPGENLLADRWIKDGWNFGYFYWDQLSDEECARDAEQKIWYDTTGNGLRWKSYDNDANTQNFFTLENTSTTVADLCYDAILEAMPNYSPGPYQPIVRFVGHSLGAQLAVACADRLHWANHRAAPHRIALLDPFFTTIHAGIFRCARPDANPKVGDSIPKSAAAIVRRLWDESRVTTEIYKSSVLTAMPLLGDPDHQLETLGTLVTYVPDWCGGIGPIQVAFLNQFGNLECKHLAIFPIYFLQYGDQAPPLASGDALLPNCPTPSSSCSNTDIEELIDRQHKVQGKQSWVQQGGKNSMDPRDDTFLMLGPGGDQGMVVLPTPAPETPAPEAALATPSPTEAINKAGNTFRECKHADQKYYFQMGKDGKCREFCVPPSYAFTATMLGSAEGTCESQGYTDAPFTFETQVVGLTVVGWGASKTVEGAKTTTTPMSTSSVAEMPAEGEKPAPLVPFQPTPTPTSDPAVLTDSDVKSPTQNMNAETLILACVGGLLLCFCCQKVVRPMFRPAHLSEYGSMMGEEESEDEEYIDDTPGADPQE